MPTHPPSEDSAELSGTLQAQEMKKFIGHIPPRNLTAINVRAAGILLVTLCFLAFCIHAEAQQPMKIPRIGHLGASSASIESARIEAFRQGLSDLGYVEEKSIAIEWRHAEGNRDRLPTFAAELVHLRVEAIATGGGNATRAAKNATSTIPIVMAQSGDPVDDGFVVSLARPRGNITGLSNLAPELNGKKLEILKEIVPRLSRVAVFGTSTARANAQTLRETELAAGVFGVKIQYVDVLNAKDFENAFRAAARQRAEAILMLVWGPILNQRRTGIADLAVKTRLPVIYQDREHVEASGLMT